MLLEQSVVFHDKTAIEWSWPLSGMCSRQGQVCLVSQHVTHNLDQWVWDKGTFYLQSVCVCVCVENKTTSCLWHTLHKSFDRDINKMITSSWMYWIRKGEARRLSTGKVKNPWISFWCKSMVMMWVNPDEYKAGWAAEETQGYTILDISSSLPALASMDASSLLTIEPLFLILHCLL